LNETYYESQEGKKKKEKETTEKRLNAWGYVSLEIHNDCSILYSKKNCSIWTTKLNNTPWHLMMLAD
jgi:hypothetical protein